MLEKTAGRAGRAGKGSGMAVAARNVSTGARAVGLVSVTHLLSHLYILSLPPLFPLLKEDLGVSYTALGLILTTFNVVSGVAQTPVGFLVDRIGARNLLICGIVVEALAFTGMGLLGSYATILAMAAIAGVANSVYHPADYAILNASVAERRIGRAFSLHTFAGFVGNAITPALMVGLAAAWGWRGGLAIIGAGGLLLAAVLFVCRDMLFDQASQPPKARARGAGKPWALLISPPIFLCFVFFVLLAMSSSGVNSFAVSAFHDLYALSLIDANAAFTGYLVGSAAGILVGGQIADRTRHHELVATAGFVLSAAMMVFVGTVGLTPWLLTLTLTVAGLLWGMIMPSRDMLVRKAAPPGQIGAVFGFVSTGLNIGAALTPALFGWLMDSGNPRLLFYVAAGFMLLCVVAALATRTTKPKPA
ncbi:MAG: MFS transporter [Alphaproteobacteria bacterium]|nr:MFS transporter [Alphaproteobacteria bacterium]